MKRQPILSICIATFNRGRYISQTLDHIIPQLMDDTELLVVDGASTDDTEIILNRYAAREPRLRYVRLPQKGGVDQDYCKAVEMASGEYCWIFTDDDLLKPGAVEAVLAKTASQPSLIVVNADVWNADFTRLITERMIKVDRDRLYDNSEFEVLFMDTVNYLSFIGGVVIRRDLWMQRDITQYFGSEFVHIGVIFQAPLPGKAILLSTPFISIRYGNAQWISRNFEIWMYKWPRLIWSLRGIAPIVKQSIIPREPWRKPLILLTKRATRTYSLTEFRKFLLKERMGLLSQLTALFIAMLPFRLLNALLTRFVKRSARHTSDLFLYDLLLANQRSSPLIPAKNPSRRVPNA